jgi:hypothetical protein
MKLTGESFDMGRIAGPERDGRVPVRLDDGREVLVTTGGPGRSLYKLEPGERVCVSFHPAREPVLTGYLTM